MNFKQIGSIKVSDIVLGSDVYGTSTSKETAFLLMDRYFALGGNCIDTARLYGNGASEETIGEWLQKSGKREQAVISTKGGHPDLKTMHIPRLGTEELRLDLEGSLKALNTDYIDIYWLHRDDSQKPAGEIIESLNVFIKEGKIKEIGASNWSAKRIKEANEYAEAHGLKGFSASQIMWSLANENEGATDPTMIKMNDADYEEYKEMGLPVFGFASQGRGVFFKLKSGGVDALSPRFKEIYLNDRNFKNFEIADNLSKKHNIPLSAVILSFVHSCTEVEGLTLIGPRDLEQLEDCMKYADFKLTKEERELFV